MRTIIKIDKLNIRLKGAVAFSTSELIDAITKEIMSTLVKHQREHEEKRGQTLKDIRLDTARVPETAGSAEISKKVGKQLRNSLKETETKKRMENFGR